MRDGNMLSMSASLSTKTNPVVVNRPDGWRVAMAVMTVTAGSDGAPPHLAAGAWLGGLYCVVAPPESAKGAGDHAGWLEFGGAPAEWRHRSVPRRRLIAPEPGVLLLFPGYFYRRMRPHPEVSTTYVSIDVLPE